MLLEKRVVHTLTHGGMNLIAARRADQIGHGFRSNATRGQHFDLPAGVLHGRGESDGARFGGGGAAACEYALEPEVNEFIKRDEWFWKEVVGAVKYRFAAREVNKRAALSPVNRVVARERAENEP